MVNLNIKLNPEKRGVIKQKQVEENNSVAQGSTCDALNAEPRRQDPGSDPAWDEDVPHTFCAEEVQVPPGIQNNRKPTPGSLFHTHFTTVKHIKGHKKSRFWC